MISSRLERVHDGPAGAAEGAREPREAVQERAGSCGEAVRAGENGVIFFKNLVFSLELGWQECYAEGYVSRIRGALGYNSFSILPPVFAFH